MTHSGTTWQARWPFQGRRFSDKSSFQRWLRGTLFEAQIGASYLLSMLLEVDARGLPDCRIEGIRLQRGRKVTLSMM
jgi:hypothetical protein